MEPNKKIARIAGLLYLIAFASVIVAESIRSNIIVPGDAATTASNIKNSDMLFRIAFVSNLTMITSGLFVALVLYILLSPVNKNLASLMVLFTSISAAITCINSLNLFAPVLLLGGGNQLIAAEESFLPNLVAFFLDLHNAGYIIANIFFGLWLLPLGYLIIKSELFPRIFGILLIIACFGYLMDFFVTFLFPGYGAVFHPIAMAPAAVAELSFALWLLIKGINTQQRARTLETIDLLHKS
jgi:hypothetical protein